VVAAVPNSCRGGASVKVLRVIARLNVGGPARHVVVLDRELRRRGHETRLVYGSVPPSEPSLEHLAAAAGLPTTHIRELSRRITPLNDLRAFAQLLRLMFREAPDVVHTHTAKAGALGRVAAAVFNLTQPRRRRCVVVHTFHGHVLTGYFRPAMNVAVRLAERALARITDRVVTLSPSQRDDIVNRFRIATAAHIAVVPLGLDLEHLACLQPGAPHLRQQFGIPERALVVGYVGRFVAIKDLPTLVRAFARVVAQRPDAVLLLVGDGENRAEISALVAALTLQKQVHLVGWIDDLTRLYATIDICALSSLNEGTPVAVIEAMAAAKAVVATRVGGVVDVVDHERTGLLVPPQNPAALADAILRLAAAPGERSRMGAAGRRAAEHFSPRRLVEDIDTLYTTALAQKRAPRASLRWRVSGDDV
jgi:glycosyltransferase involved in cell wall biosynthesis